MFANIWSIIGGIAETRIRRLYGRKLCFASFHALSQVAGRPRGLSLRSDTDVSRRSSKVALQQPTAKERL